MTRPLKAVSTQADVTSRDVKSEHIACRTFGHGWNFTTVTRKGQELIQGLECFRCGTERFVTINARTGYASSNNYRYAEGYQFRGGGAMTPGERAALRLGEVKRHLSRRD